MNPAGNNKLGPEEYIHIYLFTNVSKLSQIKIYFNVRLELEIIILEPNSLFSILWLAFPSLPPSLPPSLFSLSLSLSRSLSLSPLVVLYVSVSNCLSLFRSPSLALFVSLSLSTCISFSQSSSLWLFCPVACSRVPVPPKVKTYSILIQNVYPISTIN